MSTDNFGRYTYAEIISQGNVWQETLAGFASRQGVVRDWLGQPHDEVLFTGCGSTYYLSLSAAAIWRCQTGEIARAVPASEAWLFPSQAFSARPTLLAVVSRSAETSESIHAAQEYRQRTGNDYLSLTCYADRGLALNTPYTLVADRAVEQSVAQTRAFTSLLLLTQAVAATAVGKTNSLDRLDSLTPAFDRLIQRYEPLAKCLGQDKRLQRFVFLGSGVQYGLACEAMLKMKEMSLSSSEAFHFLEFRHGPVSVVGRDTLIIGLLSDSAWKYEAQVLREMMQMGAGVLALADDSRGVEADEVAELQSDLPDDFRAPLALPILQLLAYYRALENGLNPDEPKNLTAVVKLG
jgi:glucosamine--fructose-6-phosphate aminotransferase (isomerizing)